MDEKIDKLIEGCPGYSLSLSNQEQQVWHNAQRAMLSVGYRKPQQPVEGGLAECPNKSCKWINKSPRSDCEGCDIYTGSLAQLVHDKATMVKIDWLFEPCPHSEPLTLTTRHECDVCMEELLKLKGAK